MLSGVQRHYSELMRHDVQGPLDFYRAEPEESRRTRILHSSIECSYCKVSLDCNGSCAVYIRCKSFEGMLVHNGFSCLNPHLHCRSSTATLIFSHSYIHCIKDFGNPSPSSRGQGCSIWESESPNVGSENSANSLFVTQFVTPTDFYRLHDSSTPRR